MGKVFGYPKWSEDGEQIVTEYQGDYEHMMMDIRLFRMKTGDVKCFKKPEEETAILLLQGKLTLCWKDRKSMSREKTYGQKGCGACMCAGIRKFPYRRIPMMWKFWLQSTHNNRDFPAKLYGPCRYSLGGNAAVGNTEIRRSGKLPRFLIMRRRPTPTWCWEKS